MTNPLYSSNGKLVTTTSTVAGSSAITLTVASAQTQIITGSIAQTINLPVTSTLLLYQPFIIVNASSQTVTVNSSGGNLVQSLSAGSAATFIVALITGTTAASWQVISYGGSGVSYPISVANGGTGVTTSTGTGSTVLSNSPTLVTPALGTPASGVLTNCTGLPVAGGGTGIASTTAYAPIVGGTTATGALQSTAVGSAGQVLQSAGNAAVPIYSTPTYPSTSGTSGKVLQSDGTNNVYSASTWPTAATINKFVVGNGTNYVESTSTLPSSAGSTPLKLLKSNGTNYALTTSTYSDTPGTAGKVLISDGTNWITSTPTFPNASATTRKMTVSDGTNWVASTETWAVPGSNLNYLKSDGTNWTSAAPDTTPIASTLAGWDANKNFSADSFIVNYATIATAAATTTLTVDSVQQQYFTGSTTQTVVLPVTSTLVLGQTYRIVNSSSGTVTVQSSGANNIIALVANTEAILTCILVTGTTAASWDYQIKPTNSAGTGTGQLVRDTSPTLVTPLLGTPTSGSLINCTNPPSNATVFHVSRNTNPTITTSTFVKVQYASEVVDKGSYYDNATNFRYTPLIAGTYCIYANAVFNNNITAGVTCIIAIYKNGSIYSQSTFGPVTGTSYASASHVTGVSLNGSTDYIEAFIYHEAGVDKTVLGGQQYNFLGGFLMERT